MTETLLTDPRPSLKKTTNKAIIKVPTDSLIFRNLAVWLYFYKDPKTGVVSNIAVDLKEINVGFPSLISDSLVPMLSMAGDWLIFDLDFTMELRLGSMEKDGLAVPLPFPPNQCNVHGYYNTRTGEQAGTKFIVYP